MCLGEASQLEFKAKLPNGKQETRRVACSREDPLLDFFEKAFNVKFKEDALGPQVMEIEGQRSSYYHFVLIDKKTGKKYMPYAEDKEGKRIYLDLRHILFSPELARSMAIEIFMVYDHRDMDNSITTRYEGTHAWFKLDEFTSEDLRMGDIARMMRKYYMGNIGEDHRFHFLQLRARMSVGVAEKPKAPSPVFLFDGRSFSFSLPAGRMQEEATSAQQETPGAPDPVNDCGLKPAASDDICISGGAIFASAKMRPFVLERESGSCNRVRSSAASKQQLPRTRSHSVMMLESPALFDVAASESASAMVADAPALAIQATETDMPSFCRTCSNRGAYQLAVAEISAAAPIQAKAACRSMPPPKNSKCMREGSGTDDRNAMEIRKSNNGRRKKKKNGARKEKASPIPFSALSGFKAVIFDLDGVIVDSEMVHPRTFERALAKYKVKIENAHWKRAYTGIGSYAIFDDLVKKYKIPEDARELVKKRNEIYMEEIMRNRLPVIEGFAEVHQLLLENGVKEAVASGGHTNHVEESLRSSGLKGVPFISIEMVKRGKPSPEIFLRAAKRLRVKPSECIVFEDSLSGMEAAARAGMPCVALSTTMPEGELEGKAALIVKNYRSKKLKRLLEMLLAKRKKGAKAKAASARAAGKGNTGSVRGR